MAINRRTIECKGCSSRIMTRTALGHSRKQSHSFLCPKCGVAISYEITLDLDAVSFEYGRHPANGIWIDDAGDEVGVIGSITVDPEALVPTGFPIYTAQSDAMPHPFFSPFIAMATFHRDISEHKEALGKQLSAIGHCDTLDRMTTFVANRSWELLRKTLKDNEVDDDAVIDNAAPSELRYMVQGLTGALQSAVTRDKKAYGRSAAQLLQDAMRNAPAATRAFFREYKDSKRLKSLWEQLQRGRLEFFESAAALIPLFQAELWKTPPAGPQDYVLQNKQFDSLGKLYIGSFETLARLSVVLVALHQLGTTGATDIPTRRAHMTIWDFEKLQNANKGAHLTRTGTCAYLTKYLDTKVRNGIGHNQAHYDAKTDEVVIYKQDGADLKESRLGYSAFADIVMDTCSVLFELSLVAFWILEENGGDLE